MAPHSRQQSWQHTRHTTFDVAILGGGINGACLYHRLCAAGYKVLLADQGDFAAGTSQASGMMIWGGLLYLRSLDLLSVYRFSQARDAMIRNLPDWIEPAPVHYIPSHQGPPDPRLVLGGLYFYWLLGHFHRRSPGWGKTGMDARLIRNGHGLESLHYEEGMLRTSDARFVLHWITPHQTPEQVPLNYCAVTGGGYDASKKQWRLELRDTLGNDAAEARARWVVNCAGAWADPVNQRFGIETPYKHVLSKGVYLGVPRPPEHDTTLVFEMGDHGDAITYSPWGPISLWGPTETRVEDLDAGRAVTAADVRFLLEQAQRNFTGPPGRSDIVSLRCGLRPLAVPKSYDRHNYTLDISRRHRIAQDADRPWISLYGGKITGCTTTAEEIAMQIGRALPPPATPADEDARAERPAETATAISLSRDPIGDVQDARMPRRPGMAESGLDPIDEAAPSPSLSRGPIGDVQDARMPRRPGMAESGLDPIGEYASFPGLSQKIPSVQWCRDHEFCLTLDDYLRRRTNISQWVAREGLGRRDENLAEIDRIALTLSHGDHDKAAHSVRRYRERVRNDFDSVLERL